MVCGTCLTFWMILGLASKGKVDTKVFQFWWWWWLVIAVVCLYTGLLAFDDVGWMQWNERKKTERLFVHGLCSTIVYVCVSFLGAEKIIMIRFWKVRKNKLWWMSVHTRHFSRIYKHTKPTGNNAAFSKPQQLSTFTGVFVTKKSRSFLHGNWYWTYEASSKCEFFPFFDIREWY